MGGFLNLRLKKWVRALITRSFAIVPTIVVALFFDTSDSALDVLNEWLNVLQSIQIPFALIPLITLVSKEKVMGVFKIGPNTQVSNHEFGYCLAFLHFLTVLCIMCFL
jgi:natural resistance-associated macrophage protein